MGYLNTHDSHLLSPSISAKCPGGIDKLAMLEHNPLPPDNEYYALSQYLYGEITYKIRSERKDGDRIIVTVEQMIPRELINADFFKQAKEGKIDDAHLRVYQHLKSLYDSRKLNDLAKEPNYFNWVVLKDGVAPELSPGQLTLCNQSE